MNMYIIEKCVLTSQTFLIDAQQHKTLMLPYWALLALARLGSRVSSRFFVQPGHEMFNRSIINHHFSIKTYYHTRPQN